MSLKELYENNDISRIEEKFSLVHLPNPTDRSDFHIFQGKYPLEPFRDGARGTYGGEFASQGLMAAWESVKDPSMSPHSFHSYFVKAGSVESPIRWEVQEASNGKNYCNRLVQGYQSHTNKLVYTLQASFVKNNSYKSRELLTNESKLSMQKKPQQAFYKYKDILDDLNYVEHTHDLIQHIVPKEFFKQDLNLNLEERGNTEFGFFVRINDDLSKAKNQLKTKLSQVTYLSDSFYLGTLSKGLGLPIIGHHFDTLNFFRVSLDHSVYFHDVDFDPTEWLFLDYRFSRLNNDRVLCQCQIFTLKGEMVVSITQEGLVHFEKEFIESVKQASSNTKSEAGAKL
jgi:acyl-CoA thioesterase II